MTKALYPGSFDPITNGHLAIIERAQTLFDSLTVAVVQNSKKQTLFSLEERKSLVEAAMQEAGIQDVNVVSYGGLLVEFARGLGVTAIVRGLRVNSDFDYEFQMALMNRELASDIESVFLMTSHEYIFLSSSIVKEVKQFDQDISHLVPSVVDQALTERMLNNG